jgi:hypothetical protein
MQGMGDAFGPRCRRSGRAASRLAPFGTSIDYRRRDLMHVPSAALKVNQHGPFVSDEPQDWQFSPGAGFLRLSEHIAPNGGWWTGDFVDYRGLVAIQREEKFTRLDTVAGGYCHTRTYHKFYGDRTVAQLCRQLLTELHGLPQ